MSEEHRLGKAFVVAAPSGTGKTTVCRALVDADPLIEHSVSTTTRDMRDGERNGVHYHFVEMADFRKMVDAGEFLEHAEYNGNLYGTSREALRESMEERGRDVLLEIEVQGAQQLRENETRACFVFLLPPSLAELERRLRGRGTDDAETIDKRLAIADVELRAVEHFDYAVVNDDLDACIAAVRAIVDAERSGEPAALERARATWGRERVWAAWSAENGRGS